MVVDEERQALYVYGGTDPAGELSGMFRYDIRRGRWEELLCVGACAPAARHLPADARPPVPVTQWRQPHGPPVADGAQHALERRQARDLHIWRPSIAELVRLDPASGEINLC
jgi:hypothetical protein